MPARDSGQGLIHPEKTIPSGLHIKPSHICFGLAAIIIAALYYRRRFKSAPVKAARVVTGKRDPAWEEENLRIGTVETVKEVQDAWSKGDVEGLRRYVERKLCREWESRMAGSGMAIERRDTSGVTVHEVEIINAGDYLDNAKDEFIARISFNAVDAVKSGRQAIRGEGGHFVEFWKMGRYLDRWKVREISRDGVPAMMSLALEPPIHEKRNDDATG